MKIHETQKTGGFETEPGYVTEFENAQRIEGGRPLQKINLRQLPAPIRVFGYFFMAVMLVMLVFTIVMVLM